MDDGGHVTTWPYSEWHRDELQGIANLYDMENTPRVLAVEPDEGTSIGGVPTTITFDIGTGRTNHSNASVTVGHITLAGVQCTNPSNLRTIPEYWGKATVAGLAQQVTTRGTIFQVECISGAYNGGRVDALASGVGLVYVLTNHGAAATSAAATYQYVDYWSEPTTWDDGILPQKGDFVRRPSG